MARSTILLIAISLLSACAGQTVLQQTTPLTLTEFRLAAEDRIVWRTPDLPSDASGRNWVRAKILGFSDFHGSLNGRDIDGRPVGGAAVLAAYLRAEAAEVDNYAVIVHAGDMVGASPAVSALMQDEPSIEFLNMLANENCQSDNLAAPLCNLVGTLGNHEFDEGPDELLRLLYGGRHVESDSLVEAWKGVKFPYVSANVLQAGTGETILPPYVIKEIGGVPVAFIGAVLKNTPKIVSPAGVAGLVFLDEAASINTYVPELIAKNVRAIVVIIHQGLRQLSFGDAAVVGQDDLQGEIINILVALDDEIDIVISGHKHGFTNVLVPNANGKKILLTQAFSGGTAYADIDISLDRASGDIVEKSATIITTWADQGPGLFPDLEIAGLVKQANIAVAPMVNRIMAVAAADILRTQNEAGESPLGNLIADSHRAAMPVDFAFTGSGAGGIRENIMQGDITWGDLFSIKPFGNQLIGMTLTGRQIVRLLNQQWGERKSANILQVSGLTYTWDQQRTGGDKIVEILDSAGIPLDAHASYRVAVASYHAAGGDGFDVLTEGTERITGPLVLDALIDYISAQPQPVEVHIEGRINRRN